MSITLAIAAGHGHSMITNHGGRVMDKSWIIADNQEINVGKYQLNKISSDQLCAQAVVQAIISGWCRLEIGPLPGTKRDGAETLRTTFNRIYCSDTHSVIIGYDDRGKLGNDSNIKNSSFDEVVRRVCVSGDAVLPGNKVSILSLFLCAHAYSLPHKQLPLTYPETYFAHFSFTQRTKPQPLSTSTPLKTANKPDTSLI